MKLARIPALRLEDLQYVGYFVKIAFFHPSLQAVGGAEVLLVRQARYLDTEGLDVCIAAGAYDPSGWARMLDGVAVRVVGNGSWRTWLPVMSPGARHRWRSHCSTSSLSDRDVVIAHNYPCSVELAMAAIPAAKAWYCNEPPRNLHLVDANPRSSARSRSAEPAASRTEKNYSRSLACYRRKLVPGSRLSQERDLDVRETRKIGTILANSEFTRDNVKRIYGRSDVEVVYPIIPFTERVPVRSGLDRRGLQILIHSRLEIIKNIETVLRAFALFHRSEPSARVHVVGTGTEGSRLRRLARTLGIADAVRFHGFLPDAELRAVYDVCDVFALLPLDEPFGMVFAEAAARGLLLVGPDHGGPLEILDGGNLGWICDPFAPESAADAFARIWRLTDGEVQNRREEAARASHARFSEAVVGPRLLNLLPRSPDSARREAI